MDALTGLPTHKDLPSVTAEYLRTGARVIGIFLDLDGFVWVNHEWGHREGDTTLTRIGRWLAERSRALGGQAFRVGGDEFLLLLTARPYSDALTIADSLVQECAGLRLRYARPGDSRDYVSLSAVTFSVEPDALGRFAELKERCEDRLYQKMVAEDRTFEVVTELD